MWIFFQKGFTRSKIRIWICRKEREIRFKIENPFLDSPKGTHSYLWMAMYRCSIRERLTDKLHNCNGFFTTHRYPPFLKFRQRQRIFVQFPTATWSINIIDTRRFKIQTSDMGAPLAGPLMRSYLSLRNMKVNKNLITLNRSRQGMYYATGVFTIHVLFYRWSRNAVFCDTGVVFLKSLCTRAKMMPSSCLNSCKICEWSLK